MRLLCRRMERKRGDNLPPFEFIPVLDVVNGTAVVPELTDTVKFKMRGVANQSFKFTDAELGKTGPQAPVTRAGFVHADKAGLTLAPELKVDGTMDRVDLGSPQELTYLDPSGNEQTVETSVVYQYVPADEDVDSTGEWVIEIEVEDTEGNKRTYPQHGYLPCRIYLDLDGA